MLKQFLTYLFSLVLLAALCLPFVQLEHGHHSSCEHGHHHTQDHQEVIEAEEAFCEPNCSHDAHIKQNNDCECDPSSLFVAIYHLTQTEESSTFFSMTHRFFNTFDLVLSAHSLLNNKSPPSSC